MLYISRKSSLINNVSLEDVAVVDDCDYGSQYDYSETVSMPVDLSGGTDKPDGVDGSATMPADPTSAGSVSVLVCVCVLCIHVHVCK